MALLTVLDAPQTPAGGGAAGGGVIGEPGALLELPALQETAAGSRQQAGALSELEWWRPELAQQRSEGLPTKR